MAYIDTDQCLYYFLQKITRLNLLLIFKWLIFGQLIFSAMKKSLRWTMLLFIVFIVSGCISDKDKCIRQLVQDVGISFPADLDSCFLVIIPGNGCGSCIQGAVDNIKEVENTIYVFMCDSEKDFFLQSGGKKSSAFHNLYLDKGKVSARLRMVTTFPMVYHLKNGKYVDRWAYTVQRQKEQAMTTLSIDKNCLDWGEFDWSQKQEGQITLTNTGLDTLYISAIELSCECTTVQCSDSLVLPQQSTSLKIVFQAEDMGEFERLVTIYCNIPESPIVIPIKGKVK